MSKHNVDNYLAEAIDNIREDRTKIKDLLDDLNQFLGTGQVTHRDVGLTAAKYVETLQRSNEQLVKISSMLMKEKENTPITLSENDKSQIFDLIKES
tara:strand:- start:1047 stop:1337 length:291 start_codon:yes stop_codon:yes gene_type:complete